jgi:hypothetical protein
MECVAEWRGSLSRQRVAVEPGPIISLHTNVVVRAYTSFDTIRIKEYTLYWLSQWVIPYT